MIFQQESQDMSKFVIEEERSNKKNNTEKII